MNNPDHPENANKNSGLASMVTLIAGVAIVAVLYIGAPILIPIVIAIILVAIFDPLIDFLESKGLPLGLAVLAVLLLLILGFTLIGLLIFAGAQELNRQWGDLSSRFTTITQDILSNLKVESNVLSTEDIVKAATGFVVNASSAMLGFITNSLMVLILFTYAVLEKSRLRKRLATAFEKSSFLTILSQLDEVFDHLSRFFAVKLFLCLLSGITTWITLTALGVHMAALWSVLAFVLYLVPVIGSPVVMVLASITALLQFYPNVISVYLCFGILFALNIIIANILDPKLTGSRLNMSPVIVIVSLLFWGWIWGIIGAILAVPLTAFFRVICENVEKLKPIGIIMSSGTSLPHRKPRHQDGKA